MYNNHSQYHSYIMTHLTTVSYLDFTPWCWIGSPAPEAELWGAACRLSNAKVHCLCTVKLGPIRRKTYFQKQDLETWGWHHRRIPDIDIGAEKDSSSSWNRHIKFSFTLRKSQKSLKICFLFHIVSFNSKFYSNRRNLRLHDEFVHRFFRCSLWLTRSLVFHLHWQELLLVMVGHLDQYIHGNVFVRNLRTAVLHISLSLRCKLCMGPPSFAPSLLWWFLELLAAQPAKATSIGPHGGKLPRSIIYQVTNASQFHGHLLRAAHWNQTIQSKTISNFQFRWLTNFTAAFPFCLQRF